VVRARTAAYGWPETLKALIEREHLRGLMVMLEVVITIGPRRKFSRPLCAFLLHGGHTPWQRDRLSR